MKVEGQLWSGSAVLFFESPDGWVPVDPTARVNGFRGSEPLEVYLAYEDGYVFRWTPPFKPKGLLARLWNEARLWWEERR